MGFEAKFMQEAIALAIQSVNEKNGGPFAALVVKDGKVIGKGHNTVTSSYDPTAHAEVNAIRDACQNIQDFQLMDCDIYTTCEPCPMCLGAIYWARPKAIYYASTKQDAAKAGFDDQFIYDEIELTPRKRKIHTENQMRKSAGSVFEAWASKLDKTKY
ncbi:nucleoside deaminase [Reichenbachiella ulvae]|uniref:Nucleoside deaminase n=1 Tax=Reichenbachiella ulvae TaxID=2980104 RepID=A0ABT3CYT6_9BACT|nr:nucleoside deaminase [Reichenbachiella ulvae]MCV9388865.1 nucleoside deaminase [Reichenbachiella ulvae]